MNNRPTVNYYIGEAAKELQLALTAKDDNVAGFALNEALRLVHRAIRISAKPEVQRHCKQCGAKIGASTRKDTEFCSTAHRAKFWRENPPA